MLMGPSEQQSQDLMLLQQQHLRQQQQQQEQERRRDRRLEVVDGGEDEEEDDDETDDDEQQQHLFAAALQQQQLQQLQQQQQQQMFQAVPPPRAPRRLKSEDTHEAIVQTIASLDVASLTDAEAKGLLGGLRDRASALAASAAAKKDSTSKKKNGGAKRSLGGASADRGTAANRGKLHLDWRCDWCKCSPEDTNGKNPGPKGPATLCGACGARYRAGHKAPLVANDHGKYPCDNCGKELDSIAALGGHRRFCDGGQWRCGWCKCKAGQCSGKNPGPDGPATLCGACGSRYRAGHKRPLTANDNGKYPCDHCGKELDSIAALGGHRRFCDGGAWRCKWCKCTAQECSGKNPGPDGPATLCGACGSRYRAGHKGPLLANDRGKYACEHCAKELDSIAALGGHRRFCDGGAWRCDWCKCTATECSGKNPGPRGPATLCGACGGRYRAGHSGPPARSEDGKFTCDTCDKLLDSIVALGVHKRFCDGGKWRCRWCQCRADECSGKNPGPDGPATLCGACGSRYRSGHVGPPQRTPDGKFICDDCGKHLDSMIALGGHRRFCKNGALWQCEWCGNGCEGADRLGGPNGVKTLCGDCGLWWEKGYEAPAVTDEKGLFICELCGDRCEDTKAYLEHRDGRCPKTLEFKTYSTGADCLGEVSMAPAALMALSEDEDLPFPKKKSLALPSKVEFILGGDRNADKALEAWDLARHLARRVSAVVASVDRTQLLRQRGTWWKVLKAGRVSPEDGWTWETFERALKGEESPGFHTLYAAVTRALLRRDETFKKKSRKKRPPVSKDNWLQEIAYAYPNAAASLLLKTFLEGGSIMKVKDEPASRSPTPVLDILENNTDLENTTDLPLEDDDDDEKTVPEEEDVKPKLSRDSCSSPPLVVAAAAETLAISNGAKAALANTSSPDLVKKMQPTERLELVTLLNDLVLNSELLHDYVDDACDQLNQLCLMKCDAWRRRRALAREAESHVSGGRALDIGGGKRRIRVRLASTSEMSSSSELERHLCELDVQFAAVRAVSPSYRRVALGADREKRVYYALGDVWDDLFVRNRDGTWFTLTPSQVGSLRRTLCPLREKALAATFDEVLPCLEAIDTVSDPTSLLRNDDGSKDFCAVCGETTADWDGSAQEHVLLCDTCDADVHYKCSLLTAYPGDDDPFVCPVCVAAKAGKAPGALTSVAPVSVAATSKRKKKTSRKITTTIEHTNIDDLLSQDTDDL